MILVSILLSAITYVSPVHGVIELAGNFGESRPNHFHAGVDVKTNHAIGRAVYSIAPGYICGASVGLHGFGNALYVRHPDGNTSTYVHLDSFTPQVAAAIKQYQYKHKVYACEVKFTASMMPIRVGQLIAFSGNSGASQGPHLHLELSRTSNGNLLDPLDYLKGYIKDTTSPTIYGFKVYPVQGKGVFENNANSEEYSFRKEAYQAWGLIGFAVRTNDHMDGLPNILGVRYIRLYQDGKLIYEANINDLPTSMHRMMNAWGDYDYYVKTKQWFLKSFIDRGNKLPFMKALRGNGVVNINEARDYHFKYVVSDAFGNQSEKDFVVHGKPQAFSYSEEQKEGILQLSAFHDNQWEQDGVRLDVPQTLLIHNYNITPELIPYKEQFPPAVCFSTDNIPLLGWTYVGFKIPSQLQHSSKLYVGARTNIKQSGEPIYYCPTVVSNGWAKGKIREMALTYFLALDETPPQISFASTSSDKLEIVVEDKESGLSGYEAYIDNQFVLFGYDRFPKKLWCKLKDTPIIPKHKERSLRVIAWDNCGNKSQSVTTIKY